jgi:hypothetical protein
MQGMWDQVLLLELSGVGAVPFLCISSLLAAPKGVKGVKDFSEAALRLWELALFLVDCLLRDYDAFDSCFYSIPGFIHIRP